jgi:hypothetical protein
MCLIKTIHLNPSNLNGLVWGVTTVAVDGSDGWGSILCCLSVILCWFWLVLAANLFSDARTEMTKGLIGLTTVLQAVDPDDD